MAESGEFPNWSVTFYPPSGIVQTQTDAMRLVSVRRDFATTGITTVAAMLDDKAVASMTKADEEKAKVKARYAEQRPIQGQPPT